jgi:hypothetical protein
VAKAPTKKDEPAEEDDAVSQDIAHRQKLEDDRAAGADLPTGQRRDHPPA